MITSWRGLVKSRKLIKIMHFISMPFIIMTWPWRHLKKYLFQRVRYVRCSGNWSSHCILSKLHTTRESVLEEIVWRWFYKRNNLLPELCKQEIKSEDYCFMLIPLSIFQECYIAFNIFRSLVKALMYTLEYPEETLSKKSWPWQGSERNRTNCEKAWR